MPAPARRAGISFAESFVAADPQADADRRRALRRMKVVALSFLVGASVVFLGCRWAQAGGTAAAWVGYVRAAAEAGMVGALADWFAVTALFKHPLGIPIPHTAIIKRKKDQLGEGLGTFVRENFLSRRSSNRSCGTPKSPAGSASGSPRSSTPSGWPPRPRRCCGCWWNCCATTTSSTSSTARS
ncbi:hypothetical protein I552_7165 [Mycobacterium xenopi 3993]|nr:hypothetical protein I552_7165 [Mycobacterium xenopi 3993]